MAGAGRRTFTPGEVLTASNVMNYLQDQAVMNFAGTAARGSAIGTAVSEGMVSYLADSNDVQVYDGSAWKDLAYTSDVSAMSGLVPVIAPTVRYSGGTATANSLGTISFSGVSSLGLDGIFTTDYNYYKVVMAYGCSATTQMQFRYTVSGTPQSTNNYSYGGWWARSTSAASSYYSSSAVNQHAIGFTAADGDTIHSQSLDIFNPKLAKKTTHNCLSNGADASSFISVYTTGINYLTTQFDGIYFFLSGAGNITGKISVFGYKL